MLQYSVNSIISKSGYYAQLVAVIIKKIKVSFLFSYSEKNLLHVCPVQCSHCLCSVILFQNSTNS